MANEHFMQQALGLARANIQAGGRPFAAVLVTVAVACAPLGFNCPTTCSRRRSCTTICFVCGKKSRKRRRRNESEHHHGAVLPR